MKSSSVGLAGLAAAVAAAANSTGSQCYVLPSDSDWPSTSTWDSLNTTVNGRLIATVPIGSPCHEPNYDAAACAALQDDWTVASTQYGHPPHPMSADLRPRALQLRSRVWF